ncbi:hypothetical protein J6590_099949, partial [Homalodisca vitripennis]
MLTLLVYVAKHTKKHRIRTGSHTARSNSIKYYMHLKDDDLNVSKKYFLENFQISDGRLFRALKKVRDGAEPGNDFRGKQTPNKINEIRVRNRDFGSIEQFAKGKILFVPEGWYSMITKCRRKNPYHFKVMANDEFFSTQSMEKVITRRKKNEAGDQTTFFFEKCRVSGFKRKWSTNYNKKKQDTIDLLPFIPPVHHDFFRNLQVGNDVDGDNPIIDKHVQSSDEDGANSVERVVPNKVRGVLDTVPDEVPLTYEDQVLLLDVDAEVVLPEGINVSDIDPETNLCNREGDEERLLEQENLNKESPVKKTKRNRKPVPAEWEKNKSLYGCQHCFEEQRLSIHTPRKDQCDACCSYQTGNLPKDAWEKHIEEKNQARLEKEQDKVKSIRKEIYCLTADVQA